MIRHWLNTQPNQYLGHGFGNDVHQIMLKPMSESEADYILQEMKEQIPPLQLLTGEQLMITREVLSNQTEQYYVTINGSIHVPLNRTDDSMNANQGDSFNAFGQ